MSAVVRTTFRFERWFYISCATMVVVVTLAGFSVDLELLKDMSGISLLVRFHAAVMFTWVCLFVVQILLVAMGRTQWHRRLGIFGVILAVLLVAVGSTTAMTAAQLGGDHLPPGMPINFFLAGSFELLILFSVFVSAGIALRRRSDYHKRLMLLATLPLLDAALARFIGAYTDWAIDPGTVRNFVVFGCIGIDTIWHRRLHPAFAAGAALILVADFLVPTIAHTDIWNRFTAFVVTKS